MLHISCPKAKADPIFFFTSFVALEVFKKRLEKFLKLNQYSRFYKNKK